MKTLKLLYSIFCGALICSFIALMLWLFVARWILGVEELTKIFIILEIACIVLGGYVGCRLMSEKPVLHMDDTEKKHFRIANFSLGTILIIPLLYLGWGMFAFSVLTSGPCDEMLNTKTKSSYEFIASYKTRNCGATTYYSEHVDVDGEPVFGATIRSNVRPPLKIEWKDYNTLYISLASSTIDSVDVFRMKEAAYNPWNGKVRILYSEDIWKKMKGRN
jgi:hypothetical protein